MGTEIYREFDGYERIIREREVLRKYGQWIFPRKRTLPSPYIERLHPRRLRAPRGGYHLRDAHRQNLPDRLRPDERPAALSGRPVHLSVPGDSRESEPPGPTASPRRPNQTGYYDLTVRRVAGGLVSNYLLDEIGAGDLSGKFGPGRPFLPQSAVP